MPDFLLRALGGAAIGAAFGYGWHRLIGCGTGACPLWATPRRSLLVGALLGLLFALSGRG